MALLTAMIWTEPPVGTGESVIVGRFVSVGRAVAVPVAVGAIWVTVGVSVGRLVRVGKGLEVGKVGNGAYVTVPKLNKAVGVATAPRLGKTTGLGTRFAGSRREARPTRTEHRQQEPIKKTGRRIFPICPCWSYILFSATRKLENCSITFLSLVILPSSTDSKQSKPPH
jgi:hypothetical protein